MGIKYRSLAKSLQNYINYVIPAMPTFGKTYYVKKTGSDSWDGLSVENAFLTISRALTVQALETEDLGDVIFVLPGTYTEFIEKDLADVWLRGVSSGGMKRPIVQASANEQCYSGALSNSTISGIDFYCNTSTVDAVEAFHVDQTMISSAIIDCGFYGQTASPDGRIGLQIGGRGEAGSATWEYIRDSLIANCYFGGTSKTYELDCGINFGVYADSTTNQAQRLFQRSHIFNNMFMCHKRGINLLTGNSNNQGSLISYNTMASMQAPGGPIEYGIRQLQGEDSLTLIHYNNIKAGTDGISGFANYNTMGNIVSIGAGVPAWEYAI